MIFFFFFCVGRHQAAVCELDGYMYVIGGAESWNCLNSVERYNPENNTWTLVAPMNVARRGAGVGIYAGKKEKISKQANLPMLGSGEALSRKIKSLADRLESPWT